jgi:hypothetical protein
MIECFEENGQNLGKCVTKFVLFLLVLENESGKGDGKKTRKNS